MLESVAGSYLDVDITFTKEFKSTPQVVISFARDTTSTGYENITATVVSRSTSGFTFRLINANSGSTTLNPQISWIAVAS